MVKLIMKLLPIALAAAAAACGAHPGSGPPPTTTAPRARRPTDSAGLQALARAEEQRFARAVAAEPRVDRPRVEAVSPEVFVDLGRGVVYVLGPRLVALDLASGAERWRLADVTGDSFWRVGRSLVVVDGSAPRRPRLSFVDLDAPRSPRACALAVPAPPEADVVSVQPFDRAGQPYVFWRSTVAHRRSGVPPSEEQQRRAIAAEACGVLVLDPSTCAPTAARIGDFLLSPPRDNGALVEIAADDCRYLNPTRDMPAFAAALAPGVSPAPAGSALPSVQLATVEVPPAGGGCLATVKVTIEARDSLGGLVWQHALPDRTSAARCPPPP